MPPPRLAALALVLAGLAPGAAASDIHLTGGLALKGYDAVAYFREGIAVPGKGELGLAHGGARYLFSKEEHRDAFAASPERFLPQYGGYCAFGASRSYKADIDPAAFSIVDAKLYLNYNAQVRAAWLKDLAALIRRADEHWPQVRSTTKVHH